jgi:hypothetical protein
MARRRVVRIAGVGVAGACLLLVSCPPSRGGAGATRVDATGDVPTADPLAMSGSTLVGLRSAGGPYLQQVTVSGDGGRTWTVADLPGAPSELVLTWPDDGLYAADDVAVVVGRDAASASATLPVAKPGFFAWVSTEGGQWAAHRLGTAGGLVGEPRIRAVGDALIASTSSLDGFNLVVSTDRGRSWHQGTITGLSMARGEGMELRDAWAERGELLGVVDVDSSRPARPQLVRSGDGGRTWSAAPCGDGCPPRVGAGGLIVRYGETSVDGGATWRPIEVDPPPPPGSDDPPAILSVTSVPAGWLATASSSEPSDVSFGQLLRSSDGQAWRQMLPPDLCTGHGRPNSRVGEPVAVGGRWYVTYGCSDLSAPRFGVIYRSDDDARAFEPIESSRRDGLVFGGPMVAGDTLVLPEFDEDRLVGVTTID